jgi:hypothetical protein
LVEVEGVDVEGLANVLDIFGAQDVEGGGADAGVMTAPTIRRGEGFRISRRSGIAED